MAVFYASASLSGAFSGLLAFGIEKMDGIGGEYSRGIDYAKLDSNCHRTHWLAMDVCILPC
jgi:hypothetical protein